MSSLRGKVKENLYTLGLVIVETMGILGVLFAIVLIYGYLQRLILYGCWWIGPCP